MFIGAGYEAVQEYARNGSSLFLVCISPGFQPRGPLYFWSYVYYLSKFYELIDTAVLILRGKGLNFLHVFHHASVILMAYLWLECAQSLQTIALMTNTFIHVIMYSYYFLCSIGVQPPWKKLVTQSQIIQFAFSHLMGYWRIAVNGDGHWNDLDDGMWLSLWYPSGGYCLFEGVGDSSAAGSIYVQCLGAFSPAGGLVIDTHFMGYWHLVVNGDGHWNDLDDGMWLSLWYPSDGYCLFECVGDSSTARFLGVSWIRLTLAPSPCTVLMVITHAGGLVFFDLDMKYWPLYIDRCERGRPPGGSGFWEAVIPVVPFWRALPLGELGRFVCRAARRGRRW
ncbi:hypothetical protein CYMTET_26613 [Cymbomonas tetramitiformis]|uniref:very-long-chain 3-oxoacyl-CoA synthase n=1 Tax=Cymbomonas tetramitiformis TaxID=36881 RepID=A0AAE0FS71_9CHLO|nr:hypothetical protein CYMTET_26613 [Cymbomonas tetramitiformis]